MKRILLSSVLFLAGYIGCMAAHDYIPYVADGKEWVEYTPAGTPAYFRYTIDGTAEIEGKEYQIMAERRYAPMETPSYTDGEPIYVREENKRVYIYRNGQEELIYDFNLEAGDAVAATGDAGEYTIHVDSVVEREVAGKLHNFYYVWYESDNFPNTPGTDKLCDTWVEGIGAVNIAILHSNGRFGQSGTAVFSYYREPSTDFVYPEEATTVSWHEYIPYLTMEKQWVEYSTSDGYYMYTLKDTVTINGQEYCRMDIGNYQPWSDKDPIDATGKYIYLYEIGQKVYKREENGETCRDVLLYDFNMQPGDSIEEEGFYESVNVMLVDSIGTITLNSLERNIYYVTCKHYYTSSPESAIIEQDVWIEGIGSIKFPIMTSYYSRFGATGLIYWSYYYEPSTDFVYPEGHDVIDFSSVNAVMTDAVLRRDGSLLSCSGRLTLYDLGGRHVADGSTIDLARLPRGVYVAKAELSGGTTAVAKVVW